ncbi:MAG: hypothetical protein ABEJ61_02380 [Haloferacaceae archaeon]
MLKSGVAGALATGGLLATGSASGRQGGVAYLKEGQLRGKNSPDEPTFRVIEACWTDEVALPCDGTGERRYTAYKIRCPNYPGGGGGNNGGHDDGHTEAGSERYDTDHEGGDCPGRDNGEGGCGRQMLVNPNRDLRTGHLHVFTAVQDCGDGYVRAAFGPA